MKILMNQLDLSSILDAFSSPVMVAKPVYDGSKLADFEILHINEAFKKSITHSICSGHSFLEIRDILNADIPWFDIAEKTINGINLEPVTYYSEQLHCWMRVQMRGTSDGLLVVNIEDVTEEKNHAQKLKKTAYHDFMTGLPNRNQFNEEFPAFLMKAEFNSTKVGVLIVDIDNMKYINDSKGHSAGDKILIDEAKVLSQLKNSNIIAYKHGDDEFLVIIQNANAVDTIINSCDAIFEAFQLNNINVSCGLSVFPDDSKDENDLLRYSDIAVHCAKKQGKNQFQAFVPEMQKTFIQKLSIQNKMTQAVLESKFKQVYQPQFDVKSNTLRGFEALIRWHDEELGDIPPSVFIPMAEECGLIIPIGNWVINTAFSTLKQWQTKYDFKGIISINLSPIQLKQPSIIDDIKNCLDKYQLSPNFVEIEITEGIMIDSMEDAISKMKTLKDMGFKISLDDFGTGYSSLSYLQMLPLDTLKIDKSFINDITSKDGIQANITNSIIMMVSQMGLDTIAEGVEHDEQYELLKKFNCHIIQGFLCGKPMTEERCSAYLSGNQAALISLQNPEQD